MGTKILRSLMDRYLVIPSTVPVTIGEHGKPLS